MGCDIHCFAERREGGAWRILPPPVGTGYSWKERDRLVKAGTLTEEQYDAAVMAPYRYESDEYKRDPAAPAFEVSPYDDGRRSLADWFDDRNYRLFAMLADVRNRGEDVRPIAQPRGVPADASPEYREEVEQWGADGHSHTFFTVAELRGYFGGKSAAQFQEGGIITGVQAEALMEKRELPQSWSGGMMGRGLVVVDLNDYLCVRGMVNHSPGHFRDLEATLPLSSAPEWFKEKYPADRDAQKDGFYRVYVQASWPGAYAEDAGRFLKLLDELEKFGPAEDVRVVCFFDN